MELNVNKVNNVLEKMQGKNKKNNNERKFLKRKENSRSIRIKGN